MRNVIEANDRTLLGNSDTRFAQRTNCAERGHVVEGHQGSERTFLAEQVLSQFVTSVEAGERIAGFGQVQHQIRVDFESMRLREIADTFPARRAIRDAL